MAAALVCRPAEAAPRFRDTTPPARAASLPSGTPPFPHLLAHDAARPPWPVAGVDRVAGTPPGTMLKDPAAMVLAGVTVDAPRHLITVTGGGVVLDSFDFGLDGGWGVVARARGTVIKRSAFRVGANNRIPITETAEGSGLSILQTTIDGGGTGVAGKAGDIFALVAAQGTDLTVEESWMRFAPVDAIDFNGGGTLVVRNNLFNNLGYALGAHADSVQFAAGTVRHAVITRNTVYDPQPVDGFPVLGGEGLQVEAQLGGRIADVHLTENTIVTTGPLKVAGYLIAIRQDAGSQLDGLLAADNYLDTAGGWGPFYPPSGRNLTFRHNVDLRTGRVFPVPAASGAGR